MTSWPELAGAAAQALLAAIFVVAALSKVNALGTLRQALVRLGLPERASGVASATVLAAELATGAALLLAPASGWPRAAAIALATGFAAAGSVALLRGEQIDCACFGAANASRLGWRQIGQLPLWIAAVAVSQSSPPAWTYQTGLLALAFITIGLACWRIPAHLRVKRAVRADRLALGDLEREWRVSESSEEIRP